MFDRFTTVMIASTKHHDSCGRGRPMLLDDVASVRDLHARATEGGADVSDVIVNGRGTMIYFTAAEGYRIEVSCQRTQFG